MPTSLAACTPLAGNDSCKSKKQGASRVRPAAASQPEYRCMSWRSISKSDELAKFRERTSSWSSVLSPGKLLCGSQRQICVVMRSFK
ncbi:unnamed protein product [Symbiodinium pilosum]|uniref:Uncharacterized protein n=1 Tax=Symbiodinium pilosum TaxID=2952 RepID=A0A812KDT8_SYMPI|nr:unnamed protein product [Symbiodinium pilosum]